MSSVTEPDHEERTETDGEIEEDVGRDVRDELEDGRTGEVGVVVEAICTGCQLTRLKRSTRVDRDAESPSTSFKHSCHRCQSVTWWNPLRYVDLEDGGDLRVE